MIDGDQAKKTRKKNTQFQTGYFKPVSFRRPHWFFLYECG